jgi:hypothetical protein
MLLGSKGAIGEKMMATAARAKIVEAKTAKLAAELL